MGPKDIGECLMARQNMAQVLILRVVCTNMIMIVTEFLEELKENPKEWPVANHHYHQGVQDA